MSPLEKRKRKEKNTTLSKGKKGSDSTKLRWKCRVAVGNVTAGALGSRGGWWRGVAVTSEVQPMQPGDDGVVSSYFSCRMDYAGVLDTP